MTDTAARPRLKITYATLRNDNDELHAQFEAGLERGADAAGWLASQLHRRPRARRRGHVREAHAHRRIGSWAPSRRAPGRTSATPSRRPGRRSRPGLAGRGRSAWRSCAAWRTSSASARWSGARCSSIEVGKNRLEALGDVEETADLIRWSCDMVERNDGFDHPMGNLGDAGRAHALGAQALRRVGRHQPLQLPVRAVGRPGRRGARGRQHGRLQALVRRAAVGRAA